MEQNKTHTHTHTHTHTQLPLNWNDRTLPLWERNGRQRKRRRRRRRRRNKAIIFARSRSGALTRTVPLNTAKNFDVRAMHETTLNSKYSFMTATSSICSTVLERSPTDAALLTNIAAASPSFSAMPKSVSIEALNVERFCRARRTGGCWAGQRGSQRVGHLHKKREKGRIQDRQPKTQQKQKEGRRRVGREREKERGGEREGAASGREPAKREWVLHWSEKGAESERARERYARERGIRTDRSASKVCIPAPALPPAAAINSAVSVNPFPCSPTYAEVRCERGVD